ncbi:MAG TPA: N-acetylmuramoyl-L-alanine amidase [Phnomibacter sp.]|nr:N-acetylmuramoyl-L-alanine amidase [Phnomibacter sp.]
MHIPKYSLTSHLLKALGLIAIAACSTSKPYHSTNQQYRQQAKAFGQLLAAYPLKDSFETQFVGTTNFSMRKPNFVILHHTAQNSCQQTLQTFTLPRTAVSAHYVICRTGSVFHMLNDYLRAHHAGVSYWGQNTDLNSSSIGIEIDNNGSEPFTPQQISSLTTLLGYLKKAFNIPASHFIGHADIAPGRKVDPSRHFPWQQLASQGYGIWYDTTNLEVPETFDALTGLRLLGYNLQKPTAAIQSYRIHYTPADSTATLNPADRKIIYSLLQQAE